MKHIIVCFTALLLGFAASAARAANEQGFYIGAGLGQFNVQVDNLDDAQDVAREFDSDDTSWKVFAGWRIGPYFSVELDYIDFGGGEDNGASLEVAGIAPYLVGTLPLGIFELTAQVGYYFYDLEIESVRPVENVDESEGNFVYGAGFGLILFEHLETKLLYEFIDIENTDDSDALWFQAAWRF